MASKNEDCGDRREDLDSGEIFGLCACVVPVLSKITWWKYVVRHASQTLELYATTVAVKGCCCSCEIEYLLFLLRLLVKPG